MEKKTGSRILYIDALRTLACFAVVLLHVAASESSNVEFGSHNWNVFMIYETLTNWAVPVFVMISGAMMLSKEYSYKDVLKKAGRVAVIFFIWSFIYLIAGILLNGTSVYKADFIWLQVFLQGHYHMWYLIMVFGLYLIAPFLKPIADNKTLLKAFLILSLVFCFVLPSVTDLMMIPRINRILSVPVIGAVYRALTNITSDMYFHMVLGFAGYFVFGYAMHSYEGKSAKKSIGFGILAVLAGSVIVYCGLRASNSREMAFVFLKYYQFGIFLQACGMFLIFKNIGKSSFVSLASKLSAMSLGIYLLHPLMIEISGKCGVSTLSFASEVSVIALSALVFAVCAILCRLLLLTKITSKTIKL